jgi:branched-chain amino acid aminotransferase
VLFESFSLEWQVPMLAATKAVPVKTAGALCWKEGVIAPAVTTAVSVLDHGLLYGDGVFEGLRFYRRRVFRLADHLRRLEDSARAIGLQIPLAVGALAQAIAELVAAFECDDGYLRLVVTRGVGPLGLDPARCAQPTVFIIADRLALVGAEQCERGVDLIIAATRRLGVDGLDPRIKSLNYLNHILARMEATHAGADEAILLNAQGRVAEASSENIFVVRDNVLRTPPVIDGALDGITRNTVITLARDLGIECSEASLAPYDLYNADEAFLTGTGAELIPVRAIDGRELRSCPGPYFVRLRNAFRSCVLHGES